MRTVAAPGTPEAFATITVAPAVTQGSVVVVGGVVVVVVGGTVDVVLVAGLDVLGVAVGAVVEAVPGSPLAGTDDTTVEPVVAVPLGGVWVHAVTTTVPAQSAVSRREHQLRRRTWDDGNDR